MSMNKIFGACSIIFTAFILSTFSCRKDSENITEVADVTDIDGNVYRTLTIGTQVWLAENLKVIKYRNGDLIGTTVPDTLDITNENEPKYQWASTGVEDSVATYGRLYTWYAATDSRNLCPIGWHVPSDVEWTTTEDYLIAHGYNYDGTTTGNNIAKSMADNRKWLFSANAGAVGNTDYPGYRNKSGFTALPGGYRSSGGAFLNIGISDDWWCSSDSSSNNAWFRNLYNSYTDVYRQSYDKSSGFSVRCVMD